MVLLLELTLKPLNEGFGSLENVTVFEKDAFTVMGPPDLGVTSKFDVVLSDMAPNTIGIKDVDQIRSLELAGRYLELYPLFLSQVVTWLLKFLIVMMLRCF